MSDVGELTQEQKDFLEPYLPPDACASLQHETRTLDLETLGSPSGEKPDLPFVTLTYATSLDSMIALAPGVRTTLSGPESKCMTHYLRLRHDAILVGAGTAVVDDPSLNCRYPGASFADQPQPVIVDTKGRFYSHNRKACRLAREGQGKRPWIVSGAESQFGARRSQLREDHLLVYEDHSQYPSGYQPAKQPSTTLSWVAILAGLKQQGVNSVMIEGGAAVINALLSWPDLIDAVIITIAPTYLGHGGVAVAPAPKYSDQGRQNAAWLQETRSTTFGRDIVLCGKLRREETMSSVESSSASSTKLPLTV
ncbi:2,5-diamino-6-ribosylamino-4(3H)-pyrimidinone 5 -phosphate reductase [Lecanosticta acicola]|uniref:2,5-diamino-6-ribosylamino-4(3H)-pyrimidinone 5'-phosphate reductase n=1 Tax=Lecanosticta acicola TaxID=111012 RepID=A0AAI9ED78_9PEZI|nr:2,5-diamino-6-ribosylamino-4(3H)-pyrimidinone 5 -phosphate reductase [Lecanosticta acicola]